MPPATHKCKPISATPSALSWLLAFGLLICLTVVLYFPATRHSFLNYDDDEYVTANLNVQSGLSVASLKWAFSNIDVSHWQPITWISHIVDCSLYGLNPGGHHLTSVLLHTVNVCFLFALLYWITGAFGRSVIVAALFAVHPVNVEAVAWVAERKTLVCTFFTLATVAAYTWYGVRPHLKRYLVVLIAFSLAVMSKSMAVTVPVLLLLLDYWALGRWESDRIPAALSLPAQSTGRLLLEKAPLLAISAAISLLTIHAQEKGEAVSHVPLGAHIAHVLWSCFAYAGKLVWPSNLSILYPYPQHNHPAWVVAFAALGLIFVTVVVLRAKSKPYLAAGWFFFLISMLPVIGIIQVGHQSLADHYLYTPAIGLFVLATWSIHEILARASIRPAVAIVLGAAVIAGYASYTAAYLPSWTNSYTLFSRAERLSPVPDFVIENNLAQGLNELGRTSDAIAHYRIALALAPQMPLSHYNLGNSLLTIGDPSGAAAEFQTALQLSPASGLKTACFNNLGVAQLDLKQAELAEQSFTSSISMAPESERSLAGRGQARFQLGEIDSAIDDLHHAVALGPDPMAYYWLGKTLAAKNEREAAITALKMSLRFAPEMKEARTELDNLTR